SINGDKFLLEVQTQHDKTILFRLVEYKLHGLLQSLANKNLDNQHEITIHLPQEILIQVEKSTAPAEYTVKYVANNQEIIQKIPVIKLWEQDVQSLASGGKALLLPFLLNKFKQEFAKKPSDEQIGRRFIDEIKTIAAKIYQLFQEEKISGKAAAQMQQAHKAMILGIKNEYIAKDNPAREELENMLNVSQEPFISAWDQAIEQGKDMMRPTIEAMQQAMQKKLQKEQQTMQKKLQKEQQARQKEQQAMQEKLQKEQQTMQTMQAEIARLKAQLAQTQKE
ncbi:MAG: hypothetical protein FWG68_06390, partial [Defluviitaleaceae bacterium]|nr:hypothetical protein [Defluviitaleaceae bacterium]